MAKPEDVNAFKERALEAAHKRGERFRFEGFEMDKAGEPPRVGFLTTDDPDETRVVCIITDPDELTGLFMLPGTARRLALELINSAMEADAEEASDGEAN